MPLMSINVLISGFLVTGIHCRANFLYLDWIMTPNGICDFVQHCLLKTGDWDAGIWNNFVSLVTRLYWFHCISVTTLYSRLVCVIPILVTLISVPVLVIMPEESLQFEVAHAILFSFLDKVLPRCNYIYTPMHILLNSGTARAESFYLVML